MGDDIYDIAVIGGGPAAFAAGIYAGRAGLRSVILERGMPGGQMQTSYLIENWPGEKGISGADLTMKMKEHAEQYTPIREFFDVTSIGKEEDFLIRSPEGAVRARAIIIATGAEHKHLGVPGEEELNGKGISYCATCDGFFFKGKRVLVVGGGNTALEYAAYLDNIDCDVTIVHRRDRFRAERSIVEQVEGLKVDRLMDSVIERFNGTDEMISATIKNVRTGETKDVEAAGAFIAVGEVPNNELAKELSLDLDKDGYVKCDTRQATSMPGVYAAGDITGGLKQIVIAAAQGARAATSAFEDLSNPYWVK